MQWEISFFFLIRNIYPVGLCSRKNNNIRDTAYRVWLSVASGQMAIRGIWFMN